MRLIIQKNNGFHKVCRLYLSLAVGTQFTHLQQPKELTSFRLSAFALCFPTLSAYCKQACNSC